MIALPIVAGFGPGAPIAIDGRRRASVESFVASARLFAESLPPARSALLLCEDRVRFALALSALLIRGTTALLPPSRTPRVLAAIAASRGARHALVDRPGVVAGLMELVVPWPGPAKVGSVPVVDAAHVAATVYTSGTTGAPQPHDKTWGSLVRGAHALGARSRFAAGTTIVGAVPPQHMWGLEATVMLALQCGGVVHAPTPLLPADLAAKLREIDEPRCVVLTPLHARACVVAGVGLPPLAGALTATSSLDADVARAFEALGGCTMLEIYGSSETGAVATRRPAHGLEFAPLEGVAVNTSRHGVVVDGGHVVSVTVLRDRIEPREDGRFVLVGRDADLVKVGGKRASLAMLNATLRAIPGVVDAEYVVLESRGLSARLAALVVAPGVDRATIVASLRARIDPVFLPRPLHVVDALPRNALGKVPRHALVQRVHALGDAPSPPRRSP